MTCHGRSISSAVLVSCSMTGLSTVDPKELCIGAVQLRFQPPSPARVAPFMKLRLSQSKCGSTVIAGLAGAGHDHLLNALHFGCAGWGFIVESVKMKESMRNVEAQLVIKRGSKFPGLALRGLDADDDLAVLKRNHVRRARVVHEPPVNFGNPFVGNKRHFDFLEIR